jgi:hypothetical protein
MLCVFVGHPRRHGISIKEEFLKHTLMRRTKEGDP